MNYADLLLADLRAAAAATPPLDYERARAVCALGVDERDLAREVEEEVARARARGVARAS